MLPEVVPQIGQVFQVQIRNLNWIIMAGFKTIQKEESTLLENFFRTNLAYLI